MNVVSLCSGVGLIDLGLEWAGMRTVQVCEIDPWCRTILERRFPDARVHDDVWTIQPDPCDLIAAGVPCQPISLAGKRRGQDDDRWLWPAVARSVRLARPRYVLLENVPGITSLGLGDVLRDLASLGFDADWTVLGAWQVGALHRRDRWWLVATSDADQAGRWDEHGGFFRPGWGTSAIAWAHGGDVADTDEERRGAGLRDRADVTPGTRHPLGTSSRPHMADAAGEREREPSDETLTVAARRDAWTLVGSGGRGIPQPGLGRAVDGSAPRVDGPLLPAAWIDGTWEDGVPRVTTRSDHRARRNSALGNGVVPQCVELIGLRIQQLDREAVAV